MVDSFGFGWVVKGEFPCLSELMSEDDPRTCNND